MRGRIKRFIEDKGYGFITGEDGQDYFFHISQVRDMVEIKNWMIVNFDIVDGKKGKNAVNIRVSEQNNTSRFVTCGNVNIRLNNIKEYGVGQYPILCEKIFVERRQLAQTFLDKISKGYIQTFDFSGQYRCHGEIEKDEVDDYINDRTTTAILVIKLDGEIERVNEMDWDWITAKIKKYKCRDIYTVLWKKYLYIETYQKENFQFKEDEVSFNILDKYNEINNAMKM